MSAGPYDWEQFHASGASIAMPSSVPPGMRIELLRAPLKDGKAERAEEWMRMLNDRYDEGVATLADERMAFEPIFFATEPDGSRWVYHLCVYGEGGGTLNERSGALDADHAGFSRECKEVGWELLEPKLYMAPDDVRGAMVDATQEQR